MELASERAKLHSLEEKAPHSAIPYNCWGGGGLSFEQRPSQTLSLAVVITADNDALVEADVTTRLSQACAGEWRHQPKTLLNVLQEE